MKSYEERILEAWQAKIAKDVFKDRVDLNVLRDCFTIQRLEKDIKEVLDFTRGIETAVSNNCRKEIEQILAKYNLEP